MFLKVQTTGNAGAGSVNLRCPACRQNGVFGPIPGTTDLAITTPQGTYIVGEKICPNIECRNLVYVIHGGPGNKVAACFPPSTIDYDTTNVPAAITAAFTEAITCHAHQCFIAADIMVRKTLEELCRERNATGNNLKDRLRALGTKVVLPQELLTGLDDLRLLGNDAAHIESKEFDKVGQEEVEVGVEFTKEVLKAVYQYSSLLKRLQSLKKTP